MTPYLQPALAHNAIMTLIYVWGRVLHIKITILLPSLIYYRDTLMEHRNNNKYVGGSIRPFKKHYESFGSLVAIAE